MILIKVTNSLSGNTSTNFPTLNFSLIDRRSCLIFEEEQFIIPAVASRPSPWEKAARQNLSS